ncbi:MAG: flagellar motor stator protein MotA [Lachnospiraceae bacterium]|jgi:chemotaxis protein MotA|nr:flagellar motor stator protein MotA [Lachnospiraceae bacterium]
MDITTIIGIVVAVVGLLSGMVLKGVPLSALWNAAALLIILVGTAGAVLNATPKKDITKLGSLFKLALIGRKEEDNTALIKQFVNYAQMAHVEGLLSLEDKISKIEDPFFKWSMGWLMAGQDADFVKQALETEIDNIDSRHKGLAGIFSQAGSYAPTLGVLGAVVGLIAAMGFMDDTEMLAHAIAGAFMATIYGIFTGYVLWNPFSNRLKRMNAHEIHSKRMIAEGVLLLQQNLSPSVVEDYLLSYLTTKEMVEYRENNNSGGH